MIVAPIHTNNSTSFSASIDAWYLAPAAFGQNLAEHKRKLDRQTNGIAQQTQSPPKNAAATTTATSDRDGAEKAIN